MADCHWAELPEERKQELLAALEAAESANPIRTRWEKAAAASERASRNGADEAEPHADADAGASTLLDDADSDTDSTAGGGDADNGVSRFE